MNPLIPGDHVWYWARRAGERAHVKSAIIRDINIPAGMARVEVYDPPIAHIPLQLVTVKRLHRILPRTEWMGAS